MISQSSIRAYASTGYAREGTRRAKSAGYQTAFLSHSHKDATLAKGLQSFLRAHGWMVYIDWEDATMPNEPSRETARKIKNRIKDFDWFLYLATENSANSRWCPWEMGYADGVKEIDEIVIVPTKDSTGRNHGNEYLNLYRHIWRNKAGDFAVFEPEQEQGISLKNLDF